jgi:thiol-disulfide isomerase/thioredoxin
MIRYIIFLLLFNIFLTECFSQKTERRFHIKGQLSGFPDSTIIYLDDLTGEWPERIDSALLMKSQFHFSGTVDEEIRYVVLHTVKFIDSRQFWLENSVISFAGAKGKFREAVIKGSKTEIEQRQLDSAIKINRKPKEENILFIQNHPNSLLSTYLLSVNAPVFGGDTTTILYERLTAKMKRSFHGKRTAEFLRLNRSVKIGQRSIDFTEKNVEGREVSLSDFRGKVVLLEFWGSWCPPCRYGNPELVQIYREFKDKGFEIFGVAADENRREWVKAVRQDSLPWENVSELKGMRDKAVLIYGVSYYPSSFLIDRNGIVIARDLRGNALRKKLQSILD